MRKKKNSKLRSALAIFLAGAMVLGMIPGGMGQVYCLRFDSDSGGSV